MGMDRRDFLIKGLGGLALAAGVTAAGAPAVKALVGEAEASSGAAVVKSAFRWGMVIDVSRFNVDLDYQRCQEACHSIHNVPKFDKLKDEIKWIWTEKYENAFPTTYADHNSEKFESKRFPVMCNHCENPPCVRVCPTKATFKRPDGIVQMDFHRCIGCRFCMAGCPYGSRSFNWRDPRKHISKITHEFPTRERGVVEKCNFCAERIAKGPLPMAGQELPEAQMPACALASNGGIVFGNLNDPNSAVRRLLHEHQCIQRKPELGTNPSIYYKV